MANKKNLIPFPEVASGFPSLTEGQFRLLGFCAYYGTYQPNPWTVKLYDDQFDLPRHRTERDIQVLRDAGLIKDDQVLPQDYFRITLSLIRHYPEWVTVFEEFGKYRSYTLVYLWKLAKCLASGHFDEAEQLSYPHIFSIFDKT